MPQGAGALRITAGSLRGRRVSVPPGDVRPTSERARQAYFNIVSAQISGARFLDLFAGSGIFSFEALSRGAQSAVAVDQSGPNVALIAKTAEALGVSVETVTADAVKVAGRLGARQVDLVYADPPYDFGRYDELLHSLDALPLGETGVVAVEHRRRTEPFTIQPQSLTFWRLAEYGEVRISFFLRRACPLQ